MHKRDPLILQAYGKLWLRNHPESASLPEHLEEAKKPMKITDENGKLIEMDPTYYLESKGYKLPQF